MESFKEVQEMLPLCLEEEIIDDEEFILLYEAYMLQNPSFAHSSYGKFSIVNKNPVECKVDFRVEKGDIPILVEAVRVPPIFKCAAFKPKLHKLYTCSPLGLSQSLSSF